MTNLDRYAVLHEKNIRHIITNEELIELCQFYEKLKKADDYYSKTGVCEETLNELKENQRTVQDVLNAEIVERLREYLKSSYDGKTYFSRDEVNSMVNKI